MKKTLVAAAVLTLAVANVPAVNAQPVAPAPAPAPGMVNVFGMWVPAEALAAGAALAGLGIGALVAMFASGGAGSSGGTGSGGEAAPAPVVVTPTTTAPAVTVTPTTTAPAVTAPAVTVTPTSTKVVTETVTTTATSTALATTVTPTRTANPVTVTPTQTAAPVTVTPTLTGTPATTRSTVTAAPTTVTSTSTATVTSTRTVVATTTQTPGGGNPVPGDSIDFSFIPAVEGLGFDAYTDGDGVLETGEETEFRSMLAADSSGQGFKDVTVTFVADPSQTITYADMFAPDCMVNGQGQNGKSYYWKLTCAGQATLFPTVRAVSSAPSGTEIFPYYKVEGQDRLGNELSAQSFPYSIDGFSQGSFLASQVTKPLLFPMNVVIGKSYIS